MGGDCAWARERSLCTQMCPKVSQIVGCYSTRQLTFRDFKLANSALTRSVTESWPWSWSAALRMALRRTGCDRILTAECLAGYSTSESSKANVRIRGAQMVPLRLAGSGLVEAVTVGRPGRVASVLKASHPRLILKSLLFWQRFHRIVGVIGAGGETWCKRHPVP